MSQYLGALAVAVTAGGFAWYLNKHPEYLPSSTSSVRDHLTVEETGALPDVGEKNDEVVEVAEELESEKVIYPLHFLEPNYILVGKERRSKLLDPSSPLYFFLESRFQLLKSRYGDKVGAKRMDFHVEVVGSNEEWSDDKLVSRARELHGRELDVSNPWKYGHRAITLEVGLVPDYGNAHVTLAFFPDGVPDDVEKVLAELPVVPIAV